MAARYRAKLESGGKVVIPAEIREHEKFLLRKGTRLLQSVEAGRILLYRVFEEVGQSGGAALDRRCALELALEYLEKLSLDEGQDLYFSIEGDLIVAEQACCESCGFAERSRLVEYEPNCFMCVTCVAAAIHFERERRR